MVLVLVVVSGSVTSAVVGGDVTSAACALVDSVPGVGVSVDGTAVT